MYIKIIGICRRGFGAIVITNKLQNFTSEFPFFINNIFVDIILFSTLLYHKMVVSSIASSDLFIKVRNKK